MSALTTTHSFTLTILCPTRLGRCSIISFKLFRNLHLEFASLAFPRKKVIQPTWAPQVVLLFSERKASQTNSSLLFLSWWAQTDLEDVFCSKIRMKVLKLLFMCGQMNPSDIAERLKVNYQLALGHLELLEKETVVQHRLSGRIKYFRFANTVKAQATMKLLEIWEKK